MPASFIFFFFFFNDTATTEIYTLSLHDALPILIGVLFVGALRVDLCLGDVVLLIIEMAQGAPGARERGCEPDRRPEIPFRVLQQRGGLLGVGCQVQEPAPITQRAPELERAGVLRVEL